MWNMRKVVYKRSLFSYKVNRSDKKDLLTNINIECFIRTKSLKNRQQNIFKKISIFLNISNNMLALNQKNIKTPEESREGFLFIKAFIYKHISNKKHT